MRRVAVTGMGFVSSLGLDTKATWSATLEGKSGVRPLKNLQMPGEPAQIAAEVDLPLNSPSGRRASFCERIGLLALKEALDGAIGQSDTHLGRAPDRIGVFQGASSSSLPFSENYLMDRAKGKRGFASELAFQSPSSVTDAIAQQIGATGTRSTIMNACSSSLLAIGQAWEQIAAGDLDFAVAGGVEGLCRTTYAGFGSLKAMDALPCRPFSANRAGMNLGEGAVQLVLEPMEQAMSRCAEILAEVLGYGASMDAHHSTAPHPQGEGAHRAMAMALRISKKNPEDIDLISAHATATPANDGAECLAIRKALGPAADKLSVTSSKSQFGHALGAAGAFAAAVAILCLKHQVVSPTLRLYDQDPLCNLDCTPLRPRERRIRATLVNSFAFGGNNVCLALKAAE